MHWTGACEQRPRPLFVRRQSRLCGLKAPENLYGLGDFRLRILRFTGALSRINGSTTSGDIDVELPDDTGMNSIDVHSRSGDISMRRSGRMGSRTVTGSIRSVSGDIEIH